MKLAMSDDDFKFKKGRKRRGSIYLRKDRSNLSGQSRADSDMNEDKVLLLYKAIFMCMLAHYDAIDVTDRSSPIIVAHI
jgi:hypothetical protein